MRGGSGDCHSEERGGGDSGTDKGASVGNQHSMTCAGSLFPPLLWSPWKVKVKVAQWCLTLCIPMNYAIYRFLQARILEWVAVPFSRGSSRPRDHTQVSRMAGGLFTSWATGKPKNTRVGSLSLLQQIFPTQESNRGLLHCRQILYQLSCQESPKSQ